MVLFFCTSNASRKKLDRLLPIDNRPGNKRYILEKLEYNEKVLHRVGTIINNMWSISNWKWLCFIPCIQKPRCIFLKYQKKMQMSKLFHSIRFYFFDTNIPLTRWFLLSYIDIILFSSQREDNFVLLISKPVHI